MLEKTERFGNKAYDWKTIPKSLLDGGSNEISIFFWITDPEVCVSNPAIHRSKVVLPQPEGPRKQTNSP